MVAEIKSVETNLSRYLDGFLPAPFPERIQSLVMGQILNDTREMLSVGLKVAVKDHAGLKIVPCKEVVFVIGDASGNAEREFGVSTSMARGLAGRIVEMCDAAEAEERS